MFDELFETGNWVPHMTPVEAWKLKMPVWAGSVQIPAGDYLVKVNGEWTFVAAADWEGTHDPQP